jgi:glycerol-3-phosphate acyltransferase PlsY
LSLMVIKLIISAIAGYLLGSLNAALIVSKVFYKKDIRKYGSGNAGTTNVLRTFGKGAAVAVLVLDMLKGILACIIGGLLVGYIENYGWAGVYLAGFAAVLGHNWPVYFEFKGGKGVLTTFAVVLYMSPIPALICLGFFILIVSLTHYVSLGSIMGAILWPILAIFFDTPVMMLIIAVIMAVLIVIRHKDNIIRLYNGTEKKVSFKRTS